MTTQTDRRIYWASKTGLDLAEEADRRVESFYNSLPNSAMYARWVRSYRMFYGLSGQEDPFDISKAGQAGDRGQLTSIKVNHAGALARSSVALVSQTVPEFEPIPTNSDYESLEQVDWTRRALNYFMDTGGVGQFLYDTATGAAIFGVCSLVPEWDPLGGATLDQPTPIGPPPPEGAPDNRSMRTKTGALVFRVFTPLDRVVNRFRYDQEHDWFITRRFASRFDLAARYQANADAILDFTPPKRLGGLPATNRLDTEREAAKEIESDLIPVYTLFHRKTDALPNGKYACFLSKDIMLYEGNLPYETVPSVDICPGKILRSPYGESGLHHVLGMQETYDNVASSITTNNVANGVQLIMIPEEADYSVSEVIEGLAVLKYRAGPDGHLKPEGLNLTAPNAEGMKYLELIRHEMETVYGIPATMRGTPQANIQSGSFGALVVQQALTYLSAFQYSFQQAVGATGNLIVSILKQYADQKQLIEIVGKDHAYEVADLNRDKLKLIHRVTVKSGNPSTRTAEFNQATADKLLERGVIKSAKDYLTVARTGNLDTMVSQQEGELMNIRRENELLAQGKNPPVIATDDHRLHILRNKQPLDSPAGRSNKAVAEAVLAHLQQHITALRETDPALLGVLGQTPLPPVPGPGSVAQGSPPAPDAPGGVPGAQPGPDPVPPPPHAAGLPDLPNLPKNPLTGARWTPQDGGLPPQ